MIDPDDTAKLHTIDEGSSGADEQTDSLPALADNPKVTARSVADDDLKSSDSANIDNLDWLMSILTRLDKRVENVEETLHRIEVLVDQKPETNGRLTKVFSSFLPDFKHRST